MHFVSLVPHTNLLRYNRLCHIILFLRSTMFVSTHICVYLHVGVVLWFVYLHIHSCQPWISFHRCCLCFIYLFCWDSVSHWTGAHQIGCSGWFCELQGSVSLALGLQVWVAMSEFFSLNQTQTFMLIMQALEQPSPDSDSWESNAKSIVPVCGHRHCDKIGFLLIYVRKRN